MWRRGKLGKAGAMQRQRQQVAAASGCLGVRRVRSPMARQARGTKNEKRGTKHEIRGQCAPQAHASTQPPLCACCCETPSRASGSSAAGRKTLTGQSSTVRVCTRPRSSPTPHIPPSHFPTRACAAGSALALTTAGVHTRAARHQQARLSRKPARGVGTRHERQCFFARCHQRTTNPKVPCPVCARSACSMAGRAGGHADGRAG
jgi:hypothetical protein